MKMHQNKVRRKTPAKILFFSAAIFLFQNIANACGLYEVYGWVRGEELKYKLVLAEKSKSEMVFTPTFQASSKLYPYKNAFVHAKILVKEKFDGMKAKIEKVESIELAVPDPAQLMNRNELQQVKKNPCEKVTSE